MRKGILICGAALVLLAIVAVATYVVLRGDDESAQPPVASSTARRVAPDFTFPDAEGQDIVLSQVEAPIRIVHFWASWSPYSRDELPALAELKRTFSDRVAIVALNRDTNPEDGKAFLRSLSLGNELVFAYDSKDTYYKKVGGYNMPETVFIGAGDVVLSHTHGPMTYDAMYDTLTTLLAE